MSVKRVLVKFLATGRFKLAYAKTIRFWISVGDSLLGLCPRKLSHHIMQIHYNAIVNKLLYNSGIKRCREIIEIPSVL